MSDRGTVKCWNVFNVASWTRQSYCWRQYSMRERRYPSAVPYCQSAPAISSGQRTRANRACKSVRMSSAMWIVIGVGVIWVSSGRWRHGGQGTQGDVGEAVRLVCPISRRHANPGWETPKARTGPKHYTKEPYQDVIWAL